ncbi:MAG TPA: DUF4442 domain-containing protein [Thermoleophilaceae bacterium]|jgi:acyl-coenzyme A thioesterase PaaI-like protein
MASPRAQATDPFGEHTRSRVVDARPERAVVEQPAVRELDNHVGVRHASALHAAGYAASRALIAAALGELAESRSVRLVESDVSYASVGLGPLTTTAEPTGRGWDALADGSSVTLASTVTTTNEQSRTVARLELSWAVEPAA